MIPKQPVEIYHEITNLLIPQNLIGIQITVVQPPLQKTAFDIL